VFSWWTGDVRLAQGAAVAQRVGARVGETRGRRDARRGVRADRAFGASMWSREDRDRESEDEQDAGGGERRRDAIGEEDAAVLPGAGGVEHGDEHAEPEGAAEVVRDVDERAGDARVPRRDARHTGGGQGAQAEALADAEDEHRQRDARHVPGARRHTARQGGPDEHRDAGGGRRLLAAARSSGADGDLAPRAV
jgi:hypothetical protein